MYSTNEVAKILGVSRVTVFNWVKSGRLPSEKIAGAYLIPKEAIDNEKNLRNLSEYDQHQIREFANILLREYGTLLERFSSHV